MRWIAHGAHSIKKPLPCVKRSPGLVVRRCFMPSMSSGEVTSQEFCLSYCGGLPLWSCNISLMFMVKSLPSAVGAYALGIGVSKIGDTLPGPVYALISSLNGASVGIVALAAVQLSNKAISNRITIILVFLGGTSGMLYNALWYYPVLMVSGGCATVIWDYG